MRTIKNILASVCVGALAFNASPAFADDTSDIANVSSAYISNVIFERTITFDHFTEYIRGINAIVRYQTANAAGMLYLSKSTGAWVVVISGGGQINAQMLQNENVSASDAAALLTICPSSNRVPLIHIAAMHAQFSRIGARPADAVRCAL